MRLLFAGITFLSKPEIFAKTAPLDQISFLIMVVFSSEHKLNVRHKQYESLNGFAKLLIEEGRNSRQILLHSKGIIGLNTAQIIATQNKIIE